MVEKKEDLSHVMWSKSFVQNPYPTFQHFRERSPIEHTTMPNGESAWMIFSYDMAMDALKEGRFVNDVTKFTTEETNEEMAQKEKISHLTSLFLKNMLKVDLPDHHRLRSLAQKAFTPRMIANLQPTIEAITNDLLDQLQGQETVDLIETFAFPLPTAVICHMLGLPSEDRDKFHKWSTVISETVHHPEQIQDNLSLIQEFYNYIDDWIGYRQQHLEDDLISGFIEAQEQGGKLSKEEIRSMIFLLILAGHETTVNLIGNGVLALLQHPEQLDKLNKDRTLINPTIEEMLRYDGPIEMPSRRWAIENITFHGQDISKGEMILIPLAAANHDPEHFQDPETFDITREYNKHIAFGKGIHHCLGAPLARLEGRVAILALLDHYPNLQLAVEPSALQWRPGLVIRGLKALPIKLT